MRKILATLLVSLVLGPVGAKAEELTFRFRSDYPYTVHLKLFSKSRNHVWPNSSEVWVLDDYNEHNLPITCNYGEKICYGAWPAGDPSTYWGVGRNGTDGCDDCCSTCNGGTADLRILQD